MKTIGEDYTEENIKNRIRFKIDFGNKIFRFNSGNKKLKNIRDADNADIKFNTWIKKQNFVEVAKLFDYIVRNKIKSYDEIELKYNTSSKKLSDISDKIKGIESAISGINTIMKNKRIYAKTKPIFEKYEKSLFKDKFYENNKSDLILYESSKKEFNRLKEEGSTDIFKKISALRDEIKQLENEKRQAYEIYYKMQEEFKELQTLKLNVDKVNFSGDRINEIDKCI